MPSPFPGMDPFLEHPLFFPGVRASFVVYLSEALQSALPEPYFADINERRWLDTVEPREDVAVATAAPAEPVVITVPVEERRETYLEIRVPSPEGERVVTTIEVLSLTNKTPGPRGRALYLQKQQEVLDSDIHLVEIDLLRGGTHTTAVPLDPLRQKAPPFDYHVCVHHFDRLGEFHAYTFTLQEQLPTVPIPLLPGDASVPVNLQAVFDRCYDTGPYRRRVRYEPQRIAPPLRPEQAERVQSLLREKGLLPK
jgi:hypothetical protein